MPKWPTLVLCTVSLNAWPLVAAAQADGAPVPAQPEPPLAPTPVEPPPAAPPPSEPPPGMQPPAEPAPTPPANTPPPSDAFPPPPSPPPTAKRPPPKTASPPPAAFEPPPSAPPSSSPPPSAEPARPSRATEGLFDEKRPAEVRHHEDEGDKDDGPDQFKIGPVVGVGLPSVISFGGTMKVTRFLGAGINIGLIPTVQLSYYGDATLSYQHYDIYGRIYPFGGGFFLSGGAGYATVKGTLASSYTAAVPGIPISGTVDYSGEGKVRTLMLTTLIGYFYTTSIGFSIGVDAGAQIPIAPSQIDFGSSHKFTTATPGVTNAMLESAAAPYITKADKSIHDTLEKIGRTTLPTLNLRIGWIL